MGGGAILPPPLPDDDQWLCSEPELLVPVYSEYFNLNNFAIGKKRNEILTGFIVVEILISSN